MSVQRLKVVTKLAQLMVSDDGDLVKYEDYAALEQKLARVVEFKSQTCESGATDCGPVEFSAPLSGYLCANCFMSLLEES